MSEVSAAPAHQEQRIHFEFIDGVRALCALFVVCAHAWFQPANGYYRERWLNLLGLSYGHLAVVVFIVVSGFVITYPIWMRAGDLGSLSGFFARRSRRLLPPYYAALVLSILFILVTGQERTGTVWDSSLPLTWGAAMKHFFLVQTWPIGAPGGAIAYQLWSVAVEFQIYLLTPFLVFAIQRVGYFATLVSLTIASLSIIRLQPAWTSAHPWFISLFLCGAGASRLLVVRPELARRFGIWGLGLSVLTLGLIAKRGNDWFHHNLPYTDVALGGGAALLLAGLARPDHFVTRSLKRVLNQRWLVWIGGFSYSLYLVHTQFLHAAWLAWNALLHPDPLAMFGLLLLSIPLLIGISWLFYRAFERPFMRSPARLRVVP